jgi:ATP-binding cassette subfamily C protein/ATP-binding cassette subfamily C exporter for protease/lipase/ATP-binding cassette subfamily C protein EexD
MASNEYGATGATVLETTLKECRSAFWSVFFFSFVINILILAIPLYMLQVMDRVLRSGRVETLLLLTLIAMAAVLVMSVLDTLRNSVAMRMGSWFNDRLGPIFLESSCRAQIKGDHSGADMLRDLSYLQGFIATQGMAAFFDSPWLPIFIVIIWQLHPYLGMVALASAVLLLAISFLTEWLTHAPNVKADETQLETMRLADATIRNAEVVHAMGMMPAMTARWRELNDVVTDSIHWAGDMSGYMLTISKFVRSAVQIGILGTGAWLVVDNMITPGAMIAAAILLGRALAPIEMAIGGWKGFITARLSYDRLNAHAKEYPPIPERTWLPLPEGRLTVEDLSYAVPETGHVILSEITFSAEPGEVLAIVGPSGAGKSTLCRLLVGLNEPARGEVRLDGNDMRHWDRQQLGELIGFLPQEVELFTGTLRENISRMRPASADEVVQAATIAHVHPLIQRLPVGYDTPIGDGGVRLSGGQRQRVGLARAVFGKPRVIVLDEPNANLDQAGESSLAEALKDLKQRGCTIIVVGHRPSTLSQADKILVLQDGEVTMFGPRDEIMEAWSEASAAKGGNDTLPMRRATPQPNGSKALERAIEAGTQ